MRVREDFVAHPVDGSEHPRVIVEAPDWVNVIAVTKANEVVLVRQFRFGVWAPTLELPGGMVDEGEDPAHAAARELEEETGFRAPRLVSLGAVHPNPAWQTNRCHSFLAEGCERVHDGRQDPGEDIEVVLRPRAEVPRLLREGAISHALIVAAFMLERLAHEG
jgi:8-oxo-dGTP pyrophosphatase MutT (NUDIX family)